MRMFTEKEAEDVLEKEGFDVVKRAVIVASKEITLLMDRLSFPWAMKILSQKIIHKKKQGGVVLGVQTIAQAKEVVEQFRKFEGYEGVTVQEMVKGDELILGINKTPEFGMVIMLGKGGSKVEEEKDVSFRVLPITKADAKEMILDLRYSAVLKNKKDSLKLIEKNLLLLSSFATGNPSIAELDINPLMVTDEHAWVVDARILFG